MTQFLKELAKSDEIFTTENTLHLILICSFVSFKQSFIYLLYFTLILEDIKTVKYEPEQ